MSVTTPRRRHSPAVYRRRRLAVLLLALLVVGAVVWLLVAQPWTSVAATGEPQPAVSDSSTPAASPEPTASEASPPDAESTGSNGANSDVPPEGAQAEQESPDATAAAEGCLPGAITVEALTDKQSYASGENPQLSIRLTNTSGTDCTLDVGTSAQAFTISSGSDVWWRSTDCQTEPSSMVVLLKAGQQVTSAAPLTWDRTRSATGTCQGDRPKAPGGGATYHLTVSIGGIPSATTAAFQLY
ncbi:hypothetical protein ACIQLJ_01870 [Microbacterium sp. NPDC091313]